MTDRQPRARLCRTCCATFHPIDQPACDNCAAARGRPEVRFPTPTPTATGKPKP